MSREFERHIGPRILQFVVPMFSAQDTDVKLLSANGNTPTRFHLAGKTMASHAGWKHPLNVYIELTRDDIQFLSDDATLSDPNLGSRIIGRVNEVCWNERVDLSGRSQDKPVVSVQLLLRG